MNLVTHLKLLFLKTILWDKLGESGTHLYGENRYVRRWRVLLKPLQGAVTGWGYHDTRESLREYPQHFNSQCTPILGVRIF